MQGVFMIGVPFLLIALVSICFLLAISYPQFIFMLVLSDSDFPGKADKILWFIAFLTIPYVAPFLFRSWQKTVSEVKSSSS